jgi:AbrB family looped-hinge helix DNA binding protein
MIATLTSKGQVTLPKFIRDKLGLVSGTRLDFVAMSDGSIRARPLEFNAMSVRGILKSPHAKPLSVQEMDEAVARHLRAKHAPARRAKAA